MPVIQLTVGPSRAGQDKALRQYLDALPTSKAFVIDVKAFRRKQFTGIERERKYFDIACERISRAQAQGQMFVAPMVKPAQVGMEFSL